MNDNSTVINDVRRAQTMATMVLRWAIDGKRNLACAGVVALDTEYRYGIAVAMKRWIDLYLEHASAGDASVRPGAEVCVVDAETGETLHTTRGDDAGDDAVLPDSVTWAAQLIHAHARNDSARFVNLVSQMPGNDPFEMGRYVATLLDLCAAGIAHTPRGFAKAGARDSTEKEGTRR